MKDTERLRQMINDVRSDGDRESLHATLDQLLKPKFTVTEMKDWSIGDKDRFGYDPYAGQHGIFLTVSTSLGEHIFGTSYMVTPWAMERWNRNNGHMREHIIRKLKQECVRAMVGWMDDND